MAPGERIAAEARGTAFLLMAIIGWGIMDERLADGNTPIALLASSACPAMILEKAVGMSGVL